MNSFNIKNANARTVVCVDVPSDNIGSFFPNKNLLKVGQIYNVVKVDVRDWFTNVYLAEFPDVCFNSVQFAELN